MRLVSTLVAVVFSLSLAAFPAHAQGRGNGQGKKQTPQTTRTKIDTPKATGQSKQAAKAETRTVKAAAKTERKAAKAETKAARAEAKATRKGTGATNVVTNDVEPTTPTTRRLNPKLEARLQKMLGDIPIQDAMADFKNKGQFIAAVHVSNNLGIPFADLKARMTGITPGSTEKTAPMSLGQAIQAWKAEHPEGATLTTTRVRNEVKRAEDAAHADLQ
jgi:hypothetical protein